MDDTAVSVRELRKSYDGREVVRGVSFDVRRGEIFAILGPNGAGKTTTVEILEGYRDRSGGDVTVLGADPARPPRGWRDRIGIVLQECRTAPELTVAETVAQFAGYYAHPRDVDDTVARVGLVESRDVRVGRLSGGQHRRLDVALALVGDPELLFLDEPTTGFDPAARRAAWDVVTGLRELGRTIVLTTHYMDEAQALADRVAVVVDGEIIAAGAPDVIGGRAEATAVIRFRCAIAPPDALDATAGGDGWFTVAAADPVGSLHALTSWALAQGAEVTDLTVSRPSLEDAYLALTSAR